MKGDQKNVDRTNFRKAYARIRRFCFSYVLSLLKGLSFGRRCHTGNIYESYEKIKRNFQSELLKGAKAGNYEDAKAMMKYIMAAESRRLYDRMSGDKLSEKQKEQMKSLMSDNMKDTELMTALWIC